MYPFNLKSGNKVKITITLVLFCLANWLQGQISPYAYYYRVSLKDKGTYSIENFAPLDLLSSKSVLRRTKAGIKVPDIRDIPVFKEYVNQISSLGFTLHCTSKWMNTALFKTHEPADINILQDLPFVKDVKTVKTPVNKGSFNDKLNFKTELVGIPPFDRPITMVDGSTLHNSGFNGNGILIAVLDGGFINADKISSLVELQNRKGIKSTWNFVGNNDYVYSYHNHGTAVLSVLAGNIPGWICGTAQGADYLLLRTEDTSSEFPCEEDFWIAGAEYADSAGADIITSSLGYYNFDDQSLNYSYNDLDGNTAFVTKAADIAASRGILVVNSAGNERTNNWKRIIFPADADSVIAVGAVDGDSFISTFSSAGPSADGRIKPDLVTMGVSVPVQTDISSVGRSNGTSFSCPVLSGMAACLMQAVPKAINCDIIKALQLSADRYNFPDSLYGYGIPDMGVAITKLQDKYVYLPDDEATASPNPTTGNFEIVFRQPPESITIEIISMTGGLVFRKDYREYTGRTLEVTSLQKREQGIYFIRIIYKTGVKVIKIIKLKN